MTHSNLFDPPSAGEVTPSFLDIGPNLHGTDYFVGDIHGEGRLLACGLEAIGFDFERDRLIAMGDLVNRGSDHAILFNEVIPNIQHFYSVLGNHDIACIELIKDILDRGWTTPYFESEWLCTVTMSDRLRICNLLKRLPLAISLTLRDGQRVGVLHADFHDASQDFQLMRKVSAAEWPFCRRGTPLYTTLLGRGRVQLLTALHRPDTRPNPWVTPHLIRRAFEQPADMDLMVCGHSYTPDLRPAQLGKWLFLDTGSGSSPAQLNGAALSIVNPLTKRVVQAFHESPERVSTRSFLLDLAYQLPRIEAEGES